MFIVESIGHRSSSCRCWRTTITTTTLSIHLLTICHPGRSHLCIVLWNFLSFESPDNTIHYTSQNRLSRHHDNSSSYRSSEEPASHCGEWVPEGLDHLRVSSPFEISLLRYVSNRKQQRHHCPQSVKLTTRMHDHETTERMECRTLSNWWPSPPHWSSFTPESINRQLQAILRYTAENVAKALG